MPVRVVIPLLWALVAPPLAVVVLPGEPGSASVAQVDVPVCDEEALVPGPGAAVQVVVVVLMHPVLQVIITVVPLTVGRVFGNRAARGVGGYSN